jgi:type IV pilus assembly protein PilA
MRKQKGFSLIELLIVIAIILIIAAIAIPNLLRARIAANEASSVSSIRTINTAQATYVTGYPTFGYALTLASLGPPTVAGCPAGGPVQANACLLDFALSSATAGVGKSGYYYDMLATAGAGSAINTQYAVGSAPLSFNITGVRGFCSQEDAVIRFTPTLNGAPINTNAACAAYTLLQ